MGLFIYIAIIVVFFLWMRNSTKKTQARDKAMQDSLKAGMYVMLKDGMYGTIVDTESDTLVINFSVDGNENGCMTVMKTAVSTIVDASASMAGVYSEDIAPTEQGIPELSDGLTVEDNVPETDDAAQAEEE